MSDIMLTSNTFINNYIASDLLVNEIILSSVSESTSLTLDSIISLFSEESLTSSILVGGHCRSMLTREVQCINCNLYSGTASKIRGPKCFRLARSKDEDLKIDCIMYKKTKG